MELWFTPTSPWPTLAQDEVHVWRASLQPGSRVVDELARVLSDGEQAKAERFRFERHRRRFVVARGVRRMLLSRYTCTEARKLRFAYGPHGKPHLSGLIKDSDLQFNVAHSHEMALYAFTTQRQVGVDLEFVHPVPGFDRDGMRLFSIREKQVFHALPEEQKLEAFFNCWTRKEAYVKARGEGLSLPLDQFEVSLAPGDPAALVSTCGDPQEASLWSLQEISPGPGYVAALAVEGRSWQLRCWQWSDSVQQNCNKKRSHTFYK